MLERQSLMVTAMNSLGFNPVINGNTIVGHKDIFTLVVKIIDPSYFGNYCYVAKLYKDGVQIMDFNDGQLGEIIGTTKYYLAH